MRLRAYFLCFLASTALLAQDVTPRRHDATLTDITVPQQQYQVMTPQQEQAIYTDQQLILDLKDRIASIEQDLAGVKADVKILMAQHAVLSFVLGSLTLLVPGILIAAFSIWFPDFLRRRRDRRPPPPPPHPVPAG
jgi:hypothetical protein